MTITAGTFIARAALVVATGIGAGLGGAAPAGAATSGATAGCVDHDLYQQPVAAIVAYADGEGCTPDQQVPLKVWRNDVLVSSRSGSVAPYFVYYCTTTAPTRWRTNWDAERTFNCG